MTKTFTWKETPGQYQNGTPKGQDLSPSTGVSRHLESESTLAVDVPAVTVSPDDAQKEDIVAKWTEQVKEIRTSLVENDPSVAGSTYGDGDLEGPLLEAERAPDNRQILLHRRHSIAGMVPDTPHHHNEAWWPRSMSFSEAEEAVLGWEPVAALGDDGDESDNWAALQKQKFIAEEFKHLYEKVMDLQEEIAPWVSKRVRSIDELDEQAARDQEGFQTLYYQLTEQYQSVKQNSQDILGDERSHVMEAIKDIEVLGAKLEYEINALVSKVQDVEDGVSQFRRQVDDLESKADELEVQLGTETWLHWAVRSVTGIGTAPPRRTQ
jgi:hypothetical protein